MSHKKRKRRAYIAWVIISILAVISMVGFLFAPMLTGIK
jgi:predicted nucleic acid-binding Zn ribbon protein